MLKNSSMMLFFFSMLSGLMISITSNNWLMIWCGLELSLISFIPWMMNKSMMSSESSFKYFIVQSVSSSILMMGVMFMIVKSGYDYEYILTSALLIKMGVVPFHNWILTVAEGLNFNSLTLLLTVMKIAPITMMSYISLNIQLIVILTMIIGSLSGLNQNSTKKLMTYSSIFNMGSVLILVKMNMMWIMFMAIYTLMLMMIFYLMNLNKSNFVVQMMMSENKPINKIVNWINLLSMGGMPPLLGFSIKLMVIQMIISKLMLITALVLICSSLLVMMFYLRMTFMSIMYYSVKTKMSMFKTSIMSVTTLVVTTTMMPMMIFMKQ